MQYQIYLTGSKNPVWTYKTYSRLVKRLATLAKYTTLSRLALVCFDGMTSEHVEITFARQGRASGWDADFGIPTPSGARVMGISTNPASPLHKFLG